MAKIDLRPRVFMPVGPWRLYARQTNNANGKLEGVYLVKSTRTESLRVNAERGRLVLQPGRGITLELEDGQLQLPNADPHRYTTGRFARYHVFLPLTESVIPRDPDLQELATPELTRRLSDPATIDEKRVEYVVEKAARTAGALSPFIFFWVAAPLGMGLKRRARGADFAVSLGVMFAYYGLLVVGISFGRRHDAVASVAPWLANAVGLTAGLWLTKRVAAQ
jgi:lipopolysaccharide export LptBFGC system permease protein LptF